MKIPLKNVCFLKHTKVERVHGQETHTRKRFKEILKQIEKETRWKLGSTPRNEEPQKGQLDQSIYTFYLFLKILFKI